MEKIKKVLGITGERKPQNCKDKKGALQYMIHDTKQARALKKLLFQTLLSPIIDSFNS